MGAPTAVLLIQLSLVSLPRPSWADGPTNFPPTTSLPSVGRPAENNSINWELLGRAVSAQCFHHVQVLYKDSMESKTYAGHMMNSTGDRRVDPGNPSECKVSANHAEDLPPSFRAIYCRVSWAEKSQVSEDSDSPRQGVCAPMSCSEEDVGHIVNTGLLGSKPVSTWTPRDVDCDREDNGISPFLGLIPQSVGFIITVLVLVGTCYEFVITVYYTRDKRRSLIASKCGRFLMCFSAYTNAKKVFNTSQLPGQLPVLHGLRVGSALWIIYGHVDFYAGYTGALTIGNRHDFDVRYQEEWFYFIETFNMAVDTFLVLSGFLVAYHLMKQLKKANGEFTLKDLGLHFLHRFWRLSTVYYGLLLIFISFEPGCQSTWWANLLYINNYFMGEGKQCFGISWYLAVDMQLFIIAPALTILIYKKPRLGVAINIFLVLLSWGFYGGLRQLDPMANRARIGHSYFWTPARMAPYIMGILLANVLFRTNCKVPNTRATKIKMLVGWVIGITLGLIATVTPAIVRAVNPESYIRGDETWWIAIERTIFAGGVCWLIFACCVGYGGIISEFLSWRAWLPLSRLSYIAYLIHPFLIFLFYTSYKSPMYYSGLVWYILFVGISVWTFGVAFFVSIGLEVPFFGLEKLILPQRRGRQPPENGNAPPETGVEVPGNELQPLKESSPEEQPSQKIEDGETDMTGVKNSV